MNQEQVNYAIKHATVVQLNSNCILDGTRVTIKRQSKKTGNLTCVLVEDTSSAGWRKDAEIHVMPFCVEEEKLRPAELESQLTRAYLRTMEELQRTISDGKEARVAFSKAILEDITDPTKDRVELLVEQVRWGHGIKQDLRARHAARVLHYAADGRGMDLKDILRYMAEELEGCLLSNQFLSHSTNQFSNAIEETRAEVAREFAEWCRNRVDRLVDLRAEMEVL